MPKLKFYKLNPEAKIPTRANNSDSGYDLYALEDKSLNPGDRILVKTGIAVALPAPVTVTGYDGANWLESVDLVFEAQVRPKSGLALKHGLTVLNTPGTIDNGYRGEICVIVHNAGNLLYKIEKHKKIAQLVITPVWVPLASDVQVVEGSPEDETSRGAGGFGSTGLD